jgi:translation initiation factor IF-2
MPVRIYDIARRLGIQSKEVLVKAKELGMTIARVPSSSLDKITAEYLVEQIAQSLGARRPAPPTEPPPEPSAPVGPPPAVALAPAAPEAVPPLQPDLALPGWAPPPTPELPQPVPGAPPAEPVQALALPPVLAVSGAPPEVTAAAALAEAKPPAAPVAAPASPTPPGLAPAGPPATPPAAPPLLPAVEPGTEPPPGAELKAELVPAPAAPLPPAPRIGDKVGFIVLPGKPRLRETGPPAKPPSRAASQKVEALQRGIRDQRGPPSALRSGLQPMAQRPGAPGAPGRAEAARPALAPLKPATGELITLKPPVTVKDLAEPLKRKPFQLVADLMEMGVFATVNQTIDTEIALRLCAKYNYRFEVERRAKAPVLARPPKKREDLDELDKPSDLILRPPVVTVMGHVDHGKTTLLDVIRKSNVAAGEAGGITQHIGAYTISFPHPERPGELQQITFLDTPGHAAFSQMRARGAHVTDIVVLVVAANDGVMPQTIEALDHANAANATVVVAVNKCDHPNANPLRVRQQLQERGLVTDEWSGNTIFVDVSALTKQGVDKLLAMILLQAEMLELKANPKRRAKGNVIESGLEPGGPTVTVLVRKGTLRLGDTLLCGQYYGKVRALINEDNKRLKEAGPSVAVKLLGLNGVPDAGVEFQVVDKERAAREVCEARALVARSQDKERRPKVTIENLFSTLDAESAKVLRVVVKADAQGSAEAIADSLKKIESSKVSLEIIHSAVGTVTESDVLLASASKAVVLGFHTRIDNEAAEAAKREGVQIKLYAIIYELIDQVKEAMAGLLDPLLKEVVFGVAEVRKVFALSKGGNVAGCVVTTGRIVKGKARVTRRRNLVFEGIIQTLRRFQDEVNEVRAGMECGVRLDGFDEFQVGDAVECYTVEKVPQKL